ncbi:hypothetical protein C7974DRAFT_119839 [Boeremia exigua]|uniref:uncharacterized protein n=1 Tax=Boeremia exigua TaxID=749465 RepID=UPI001E8CA6F5|nr:uncharacterized protein C7974DRAFT_119839 [Boeremia exigua]KAH6643223.1 hypothetical protein C7974DRAFT_119839 [Boeremia exigua]
MATTAAGSPSGEQIAASAYALEPLTPQGVSRAIVVLSIFLAVISTTVVGLRVWVRTGMSGALSKVWYIEDYLLGLGYILSIPSTVFGILAAYHGVGMRDIQLPSPLYAVRASEYIIYWEVFYFIASTMVKCAIGFTCTRIDRRRRVTHPIFLNLFVMVVIAILALIFVFFNCRPLAATWNPGLGSCQKTISLELVSYVVSAVQAVTDWVCALIPCYVVSKLQMPRARKISVICILALGILASITTIVRLPYLKYYNTAKYPNDLVFNIGVIMICSNLECSLGIVACSLPPLRKLFSIYYKGWSSYRKDAYKGGNIHSSSTKPTPLTPLSPRTKYISQDHMQSGSGRWNRLTDEDSSQRGIMRHNDISITVKGDELVSPIQ